MGSGCVLLPRTALCDSSGEKTWSIAMMSFDESADIKTTVSKQQPHFGQRER